MPAGALREGGVFLNPLSGAVIWVQLLPDGPERQLNLALALIDPAVKLATARALDERTAINSLNVTLGLGEVNVKDAALDWLGMAQSSIEDALARRHRHLHDGTPVL